ncbi:hypothetical protein MMC25_004788 [Agyrium rufum]|nr:hypothetical protein [Agyrium rufum]
MSTVTPYESSMRLGSGFNSYTQEMCLQDAVKIIAGVQNSSDTRPSTSTERSDQAFVSAVITQQSKTTANLTQGPTDVRPNGGATALPKSQCSPDVHPIDHPPGHPDNMPTSDGAHPDNAATHESARPLGSTTISVPLHPNGNSLSDCPVDSSVPSSKPAPPGRNMNQIVTYCSRSVDNLTDIVESLNISSSSSIKYGTVKAAGSASFVNENKINSSDLNYILTVKVTNETSPIPAQMQFNLIKNLDPKDFTEVYGDCFISGFIEGGEFNAIISIKVNSKSKIAAVKAAAEAEFQIAAAPGLSVGTKAEFAKDKNDTWKDTETTISVSWSGGGTVKDPEQKWDLPTVIDVAARFPYLVEKTAQRTSAILTRYTSLRSWHEANGNLPLKDRFVIRNYELCSLYTQDLFSGYTAYKSLWARISEILKNPDKYKAREPSELVPEPFALTPESLNAARLLARKGMVQISDEASRLITEPHIADLDANGEMRPLPYVYPGELARRLPIRLQHPSIRDQITLGGVANKALTAAEIAAVGKWAALEDVFFSPLSGDAPSSKSPLFHGKNMLFCSLDHFANADTEIESISKLRLHGHQHRHLEIFADFKQHSKNCEGYLAAVGFSTGSDAGTMTASADGTHKHIGRASENHKYWSLLADLNLSQCQKIMVEWHPGSGRIAGLMLLDAIGNEITSWVQYGQAKAQKPPGLRIEEQVAPDVLGSYKLCGFWGNADAIVVSRIGAIWVKV